MDEVKSAFYVTLPSNASMTYFLSNTQSSYRTNLAMPLSLNGHWEIALSEISIPHTWFNITEHNNFYSLNYEKEELVTGDMSLHEIQSLYNPEFWTDFNSEMENIARRDKIKFNYYEEQHVVTLVILDDNKFRCEKRWKTMLFSLWV